MIPSTQAWFAGGERVGYDPKARAMVATEDAPLRIFMRREGILAHAVSFLPGFPDGSFGWAKVRMHALYLRRFGFGGVSPLLHRTVTVSCAGVEGSGRSSTWAGYEA